MIDIKHAKALLKIAKKYSYAGTYKDKIRIQDDGAMATDGLLLLRVPAGIQECPYTLTRESVDTQVKLAAVHKDTAIDVQECDSADVKYPNVGELLTRKEQPLFEVRLEQLEQLVNALKTGARNSKIATVKFTIEQNKPVLVECEEMTGLIAPMKMED